MSDQEAKLRRLGEGDIVHANSPGGASLICIVLSVGDTVIRARRVTTQEVIDFDRGTGRESVDGREVAYAIDCVAPLPEAVCKTVRWMDEKYSRKNDGTTSAEVTEDELKVFRFMRTHVDANPL